MDHGMGGMVMGPPSSSSSSSSSHNATMTPPPNHHKKMMMMHMTFYWGSNAEILFSGWPGANSGTYCFSLIVVFLLAVLIEWLSRSHLITSTKDAVSGVVKTFLHTLRMGLAYLVMLAVMSFNAGVFIAAVAGHGVGFLVFGTRVFGLGRKNPDDEKRSDLPPMSC